MLIIPFTSIIVVVVALTTYLSHQNSRDVVNDISKQLLSETTARIEAQLETFLNVPNTINQTNALIIKSKWLDLSDQAAVIHYFWQQIQLYGSVTSIYFGNPQGGLVSGGREGADGSLYVMYTDEFKHGSLHKYSTDTLGNTTQLQITISNFDSRIRPWYVGATEQKTSFWTAPYVLSTGQDLAIASSQPIYDETGELLGVTSVDIFISHITDFLQTLSIGKTGQAYIIDELGFLVATSTNDATFIHTEEGTWERLRAVESDNPAIAISASYITASLGDFSSYDYPDKKKIEINGKPNYLLATPYRDKNGLDWLIVITIPEDDFLAKFTLQNRITLGLTLMAVIIAVVVGTLVVLQVSRPVTRLSAVAERLAQGDWSQITAPIEGVREIHNLGHSFNSMATQLHAMFVNLEERVHERTRELANSEARYRGIVEDQTELICRFLPDHTVTFVNKSYCQFYDLTETDIIGQSFMSRLPEEDQKQLALQLTTADPEHPTITIEHRAIKPNGQLSWMQWVNRALYDETGNLVEFQGVGRDLTSHKELEEMLQKALQQKTELSELKSHFISTVSHEFRTPLAIILNSSEIIQRHGDRIEKARQVELLNRIQIQINRMTNLLDDALTINRAAGGKLELNPEPLDLVALCQNIMDDIQQSTGLPILFDFSNQGTCTQVKADKRLLHLIMANLISNAVKYSPLKPLIKIELGCNPDQIVFKVIDQGIGIPKETQSQIFEPFYRANNVDKIAGTGLGLSIVKYCIEEYAGSFTLESEVDRGTTFTVTLPNFPD